MIEEKAKINDVEEELKDAVKSGTKRKSVPVFTFSDMLKFCTKIYTELGYNSIHAKEEVARINNVQYDSIKQKFSSSQEYGLLELHHGKGYKLTDLFMKIHKPLSENEKNESIKEALMVSEIYKALIIEYNGHYLPSEANIAAKLIRNHEIKDYAANKAANIFLGNLKENGFVSDSNNLNLNITENLEKPKIGIDNISKSEQPKTEIPEYIDILIPLISGGLATLRIPKNYTKEDCERIGKFVIALS